MRLADIMSCSVNTLSGVKAREFTQDQLMGTQVFLDLDNKTGRESDICWQAVVYKPFRNGTPNLKANYNQIFVNAGYGIIRDSNNNEFDPKDWKSSD